MNQNQEYSRRLGRIQPSQFQAALSHFNLGNFVSAAPVTRGLFGQNVFVTSTRGRYVLRGCPHYNWQFPKERLGASLLAWHTRVPVAHPYLMDERADIFGWSYMLMPQLEGMSANSEELSESDRVEVAGALAHNLVDLHEMTLPFAGNYDLASDSIQPYPISFGEWVIADVRSWLSKAIQHGSMTTVEDVAWVDEIIARATSALQVPFQPCFVMNDYNPGNMVIQQINHKWRVSGLFDLMEYDFGDGEVDLMRLMAICQGQNRGELAAMFAKTYLEHKPPRPGFAERFTLYMLRDRLITWEFGSRPDQHWFPKEMTLRQYALPFINELMPSTG